MYVYIIKLLTRDGFAIQHVCAAPEKAIEVALDAGHKYLLGGGGDPDRITPGREALVKLLRDGNEFFLATTQNWSGDLIFVSRYAVE
jgi:hypothetical protein